MPTFGGFGNTRTRRGGVALDPDLAAFAAASGATDLDGISAIVEYVKAQSLWDNFRLYPAKSAQNAGSGTTLYGIGGLTANNGTLINGPTWAANGVTYQGSSSQYGSIPDFIDASTLTVLHRAAELSTASLDRDLISQADSASNQRSWRIRHDSNPITLPYKLLRFADGTISNFESYEEPGNQSSTAERLYVAQWIAGGGRSLFFNKTSQSLSLTGGTAQTARHNSTSAVTVNCFLLAGSPSNFNSQRVVADAFVVGTLTTTQRETLTDLINAL